MPLEIRVLGTAAGGGFPQWNCGCSLCARARLGQLPPRTQDSLAVSANGQDWFLINASPDITRQIEATPSLWPRALRGSPISGVVLTNGDLDHVLGLLLLREAHPMSVYATPEVRAGLERNSMLQTLRRFEGQLVWRELRLAEECELLDPAGQPSGVRIRPFAAPGKPPLHLMAQARPSAGDNVGLSFECGGGKRAVYVSATRSLDAIAAELDGASLVLLDGTFWSDTELIAAGVGQTTAREMAHQPIGDHDGSLARAAGLQLGRRLLTHVNNTNPLLDPASPERAELTANGWELAEDGLRLVL